MKKALKYIALFSLILAFLYQPLSKVCIYANFLLNQDYISTMLCVDKEKPKSTCAGHCQLTVELKKDTAENDSPCKFVTGKYEVQFLQFTGIKIPKAATSITGSNFKNFYSFPPSDQHLRGVFKPPQV